LLQIAANRRGRSCARVEFEDLKNAFVNTVKAIEARNAGKQ
jgi:hypothetical protein